MEIMKIGDVLEDFRGDLQKKEFSPNTVISYLSDIGTLLGTMGIEDSDDSACLMGIGAGDVKKYLASGAPSARTQARRYATANHFFRYCLKEQLASSSPLDDIECPKIKYPDPSFITEQEFNALMDSLPTSDENIPRNEIMDKRAKDRMRFKSRRNRAALSMLFYDSLHPGEVMAIRYSDFIPAAAGRRLRIIADHRPVDIDLSGSTVDEAHGYETEFSNYFGDDISANPDMCYWRSTKGPLCVREMRRRIAALGMDVLGRDDINMRTVHNGAVMAFLNAGMVPEDVAAHTGAGIPHVLAMVRLRATLAASK